VLLQIVAVNTDARSGQKVPFEVWRKTKGMTGHGSKVFVEQSDIGGKI
jgi:hypothetical protein